MLAEDLFLEFQAKSGLNLSIRESKLFKEKLATYALAAVYDSSIAKEAHDLADRLETERNKQATFMFQDMVSDIEGLINCYNPKSIELLKIREIIDRHLQRKIYDS